MFELWLLCLNKCYLKLDMTRIKAEIEEDLCGNIVCEPGMEYVWRNKEEDITYINPFSDQFFKKMFASETSKEVLKAFF